MGTPIDRDDPIWGVNCPKFAVPAETPETIYVYFWDIEPCPGALIPPPNMHLFTLHQDDVIPCIWNYDNADFGFTVLLDLQTVTPWGLELRHQDLSAYFIGQTHGAPSEHDVVTSTLDVCGLGNYGAIGFATLFWKVAAVKLITDMNLPSDSQILMEFFVTDAHKPVYKFCLPKYGMNLKFLIIP